MHNERIKTFDDISRYLELEAKRKDANCTATLVAKVGKHKGYKPQCKGQLKGARLASAENLAPRDDRATKCCRGKHDGKNDKSKLKCYNCG